MSQRTLRILLFCFAGVFLLYGCTSPIQRNHMVKYYSNDENYISFTGVVKQISEGSHKSILVNIEQTQPVDGFQMLDSFRIPSKSWDILVANGTELEVGQTYLFTSATACWYNGFFYPIVAIQNVETEEYYLTFEDGKNNFIYHVQYELN